MKTPNYGSAHTSQDILFGNLMYQPKVPLDALKSGMPQKRASTTAHYLDREAKYLIPERIQTQYQK